MPPRSSAAVAARAIAPAPSRAAAARSRAAARAKGGMSCLLPALGRVAALVLGVAEAVVDSCSDRVGAEVLDHPHQQVHADAEVREAGS